jgi:hypothetical protein
MKIFSVGASRNIGYYAALRLLGMHRPSELSHMPWLISQTDSGHTVTFLLRSPSCFDHDEAIQRHVQAGTAKLVKGDALNLDDVRNAWNIAGGSEVDMLLYTLGNSTPFSPPNTDQLIRTAQVGCHHSA